MTSHSFWHPLATSSRPASIRIRAIWSADIFTLHRNAYHPLVLRQRSPHLPTAPDRLANCLTSVCLRLSEHLLFYNYLLFYSFTHRNFNFKCHLVLLLLFYNLVLPATLAATTCELVERLSSVGINQTAIKQPSTRASLSCSCAAYIIV